MKKLSIFLIFIPLLLVSCEKKSSQAPPAEVTAPSSLFPISPDDSGIQIPSECEE